MVHQTTGNELDIVFEYEDHKPYIVGLKPHGGELIRLNGNEGSFDLATGVLIVLAEA